jgi:hypothetical protein
LSQLPAVICQSTQVVDGLSGVDESELVVSESAEFRTEFLDVAALPDRLGVLLAGRADHSSMIKLGVINGERYHTKPAKSDAQKRGDVNRPGESGDCIR